MSIVTRIKSTRKPVIRLLPPQHHAGVSVHDMRERGYCWSKELNDALCAELGINLNHNQRRLVIDWLRCRVIAHTCSSKRGRTHLYLFDFKDIKSVETELLRKAQSYVK